MGFHCADFDVPGLLDVVVPQQGGLGRDLGDRRRKQRFPLLKERQGVENQEKVRKGASIYYVVVREGEGVIGKMTE